MAISAKFVADFADFQSAVSAAQSKLVSFETGAGKVQAALGRMETSLSGRKLIQDATLMAQAVENIGGPAKLTATELQKLGSQAQAAADKMARMGLDVPPGLQAIATAAQKAEAGQKTLGQTVEGVNVSFGKLVAAQVSAQAILGAVEGAFRGIVGVLSESVKAASEAEHAHVQITAALKTQGNAVPSVVAAYLGYADALQKTTIFQDDAIEASESLLVQIGNVMPKDMEKALTATTELASGLGIDLNQATMLVAKAAEGNTAALKKAGVVIDETTAKSGDFGKVLDAVTAKFGGQAAAIAGTYQGRLIQLSNTWNNVEESIGRVITQNATVLKLFDDVNQQIATNTGELKDNAAASNFVSDTVVLAVRSVALLAQTLDIAQTGVAAFEIGLRRGGQAIGNIGILALEAAKGLALMSGNMAGFSLANSGIASLKAAVTELGERNQATTDRSVAFGHALETIQQKAADLALDLEKTRGKTVELSGATDSGTGAWDRHTKAVAGATSGESAWAKAVAEIESVGDDFHQTILGMNGAVVEWATHLLESGADAKAVAEYYGLTETQLKALQRAIKETTDDWQDQHDRMTENEREMIAFTSGLGKLLVGYNSAGKIVVGFTGILHTIDPTLIQNGESLVAMQARLKETEEAFKKTFGAFADLSLGLPAGLAPSGAVQTGLNDTEKAAHRVTSEVELLARAFGELGSQASGGFGEALGGISQFLGALDQANRQLAQVKANASSTPAQINMATTARNQQAAAAGIGIGAGLITQNINTGAGASTGNLVAAGALQGGAAGAAIGAPFAASTFGISIAAGAAAGAIVGLVQSGKEWRKVVNDIGRDMGGLKVSEDFANLIKDLEDQTGLGRVQAITTQMDQLVEQAGGLSTGNLDLFTAKLRDAFSYLQTGSLSLAQTTQTLDKNFANFAAVGTDATGRLADNVKELITLNENYGTQSKAIATYLQQQGANAITGFSAIVAGSADAAAGYAALKQNVDDATDDADALTEALHAQFAGAQGAKQGLSDLGLQAIASFTAAVAAGVPLLTAIAQIHPALETLKKSYADLGLDVDNVALKNLMMQDTILSGNPALVNAIGGLSGEMIALDNMGLLNVQTFGAMERTGFDMYTRLQDAAFKAGGTTKDALLPMQGWLHDAADEAEKLGIPIDKNTQMLIDQSKDLGIWKDKGKSATDILTDAMQKLVDKVAELVDNLNGIPSKIHTDITVSTAHVDVGTGGAGATGADRKTDPTQPDYGGPQALGGDYLVTRPTLFLAGEAGPERATFSGANNSRSGGGGTVTIVVPVVVEGQAITRVVAKLLPDEWRRLGVIH